MKTEDKVAVAESFNPLNQVYVFNLTTTANKGAGAEGVLIP